MCNIVHGKSVWPERSAHFGKKDDEEEDDVGGGDDNNNYDNEN